MTFEFCPTCGNKLIEKIIGDEGLTPFCENCSKPLFNLSNPCVIVLVLNEENQIALIKQNYVSETNFVCVAGYIKQGETAEYSAKREVEEELGLEVSSVKFLKSYYYSKRDILMFGFICKVKKKEFNISCEVDSAKWFSLDEARGLLRFGSIALDLLNDYFNEVNQ